MHSVHYGSELINYTLDERAGLKSHYISVDKHAGVVLKGTPIPVEKADQMILKKARWILNKLQMVKAVDEDWIVTGSRLPYLGKRYYVEVAIVQGGERISIEFTYSKFKIRLHDQSVSQTEIKSSLQEFYKTKAVEKITPLVVKLSKKVNLNAKDVQIRKMSKRWGSCTADNNIILNPEAIKLPFSLIEYLIIHELCHTKVKDHSKAFWAELSKHVPNWRVLDERVSEMKL